MSKSNSGLFQGTVGDNANNYSDFPINEIDYNIAGSSTVRQVDSIVETYDAHSIPPHGKPNSVLKNYQNGILTSERYYGANGNAYLDIDYTNHGNSKTHPIVPHEHDISFKSNGDMSRKKEVGIRK